MQARLVRSPFRGLYKVNGRSAQSFGYQPKTEHTALSLGYAYHCWQGFPYVGSRCFTSNSPLIMFIMAA